MDEKKLIKGAQNGDKDSFHRLIAFYYPYVFKYLLKTSRNQQIAEDLTQETFIRIIKGIEGFDSNGKAKFSTYLITIAKNIFIDYTRKEGKLTISYDELEISSSFALDTKVVDKIEQDELMELLDSLPEEQALPIRMKYIENLTLQEISDLTGKKPMTIKSRIHNGTVKLRELLRSRRKS
ncbi:RNA polymerase sigma factor [uncultured Sphaerochaeta sp.]|uniref:RNA polymerase sigma factor n=1 Tax=uncultured Sphaerochaeta sp. TaxID=886478 RepID=UPI002A0A730A|nr:RNA polymerase sigma factor [uncultured Sphaerochaeta sp.]